MRIKESFLLILLTLTSCNYPSDSSNKLIGTWELYSQQNDTSFVIYNAHGPTTFYHFENNFSYYDKISKEINLDSFTCNYKVVEDSIYFYDEDFSRGSKYLIEGNSHDTLKITTNDHILTFVKKEFQKNELSDMILDKYK